MTNNKGDDMAMKKFLSILLSALMAAVMLSVPTAAKDASASVAMKYKAVGTGANSPKETFKFVQVGDGIAEDGTTAPKLLDTGSGSFAEVAFAEGAATAQGYESSGYFMLPKYDKEGVYTYTVGMAEGDTAGVAYDKNNVVLKITVGKNNDGSFSYAGSMEGKPESTYSAGTLAVKTSVAGSTGAEEFEYEIKLSAPKGKKIKGAVAVNSSLGGAGTSVTPKNGGEAELLISVRIKNGETVTLSNIPYGAAYSVTQKAAAGYKPISSGASGTVNKDTPAPVASFMNTAMPTVTIKANDVTADYDGKPHGASGYSFNTEALASGHSIKAGSVVISGSAVNAGEYVGALVPSGAVIIDANGNDITGEYYIEYVNGSININKRKIVITANDNTVPYDGKPHGGNGYTVSGISGEENSGLVTGHEVKNVVISGEQTEEGTYENALVPSGAQIFEGNTDVTANYEIIYVSGRLVISHVHEWGEPTYEWCRSTDGKGYVCIAARVCKKDASHKETESATASYAVVTAPECEKDGLGRHTAEFKNPAFEKQIKDIILPKFGHDYRPYWSYDKTGHWKMCSRCKAKFDFHYHDFTEWRTVLDDKGRETNQQERYCRDCSYYERSTVIHIKPGKPGNSETNPNTGAQVISAVPAAVIAAAAILRKIR